MVVVHGLAGGTTIIGGKSNTNSYYTSGLRFLNIGHHSYYWDGFGINPEKLALLAVIVLTVTLLVIATREDVVYGLVLIRALLRIDAKQSENQNIAIVIELSAIFVLIALLSKIFFKKLLLERCILLRHQFCRLLGKGNLRSAQSLNALNSLYG